jgi:predicted RND superfamily exporter protein
MFTLYLGIGSDDVIDFLQKMFFNLQRYEDNNERIRN